MNLNNKLTVLNLIYENKEVLFGKFNNSLTHETKVQKWKEITDQLIEMDIFEKDWKYLRDTTWQNWRKRSVEKRANSLSTGKQCKYDAADELIQKIVEKDPAPSPSASDDVYEVDPLETAGTSEDQVTNVSGISRIQKELPRSTAAEPETNATELPRPRKRSLAVGNDEATIVKQKMDVELELAKVKLEIAKRERYKLDLELLKLERELHITRHSTFTLPLVMQNDCKYAGGLNEN